MDLTVFRFDLSPRRPRPDPSLRAAVTGLVFLLLARLVAERVLEERAPEPRTDRG
jgi:hypothetical protein